MALTATVVKFDVALSDVDRNVYESLELRVAQHPSETARNVVVRVLAYALSYEDGIAFSKGGLSDADEPAIAARDPTGILLAWIDVGSPSAERLHKAAKSARRVAVFTTADLGNLRRDASKRAIHRAESIEVHRLAPAFVDAIAAAMGRSVRLEVTRTDGELYVVVDGVTHRTSVVQETLASGA